MSAKDVKVAVNDAIGKSLLRGDWPSERADTVLAALDAAGYAVVPKEPTEKMFFQSWRSIKDEHSGFISVGVLRTLYAAMLTAAKAKP